MASRSPEKVRGYISAPTGTGKTVLFTRLLEDLRTSGSACNTLIVVPTKQLVDQTERALVAHGYRGKIGIAQGGVRDNGESEVMITTAMSFVRQLKDGKNFAINPSHYQLVIFDEAHHLQGAGSHAALKTQMPHAMWLGFTATPDYDKKRKLSYILPDKIFEITHDEAIDEGLIAPYSVAHLQTHADLSTVKVLNNDYDQDDLHRLIDVDERNLAIARFGATCLGSTRTLYNCSRVQNAQNIAEALRLHGVRAMAVHGDLPKEEQKAIFEALQRGDITAVAQVKLIGEGFDEPKIEAIVNVSPTRSQVRARQRNRAGRIDPANPRKTALVIECVDDNYRLPPVLFNDPEMAGGWSYAPHGTSWLPAREWNLRFASYSDGPTVINTSLSKSEVDSLRGALRPGGFSSVSLPEIKVRADETRPRRSSERSQRVPPGAKTLAEYEARETMRRKRGNSEDEADEEYRALLAAEADFREDNEPLTVDAFKSLLKDEGTKVVAEFLFGSDVAKTDEQAARLLVERHPKAVRVVLSNALTNRHICDYVDSQRHDALQAALKDRHKETQEQNGIDVGYATTVSGIIAEMRPSWSSRGVCNDLDPELFYPARGESTKEPKQACSQCRIAAQCLSFALESGEKHGIWGGTSERERRRMRKVYAAIERGEEVAKAQFMNTSRDRTIFTEVLVSTFGAEKTAQLVEGVEVSLRN